MEAGHRVFDSILMGLFSSAEHPLRKIVPFVQCRALHGGLFEKHLKWLDTEKEAEICRVVGANVRELEKTVQGWRENKQVRYVWLMLAWLVSPVTERVSLGNADPMTFGTIVDVLKWKEARGLDA
eukprot:GABV01015116.1.p1 GENE.GABV01015116.1~~GABV01015116.1.p1  ORF type:complete len:134 (-),score=16.69 GABV01015116.1:3-377(-)